VFDNHIFYDLLLPLFLIIAILQRRQ